MNNDLFDNVTTELTTTTTTTAEIVVEIVVFNFDYFHQMSIDY